MKNKENNFFKKVWYSITKFEQYPDMAIEGLKTAIKYLVTLTAIVTVFVAIGTVLQMKTIIKDLSVYIENNIPDFSYTDGKISMENQETIVLEDINDINIALKYINLDIYMDVELEKGQYFFDDLINMTILNSKNIPLTKVKQVLTQSSIVYLITSEEKYIPFQKDIFIKSVDVENKEIFLTELGEEVIL